MTFISLNSATDPEVLETLGKRLRALREAQELTILAAAARASLSRRTVHRAEAGHNPTLLTVLRLLRLYGRIDALAAFIPEPAISPMALLNQQHLQTKRAERKPRG